MICLVRSLSKPETIHRRGSVLMLVLLTVSMLSYAAYTFSDRMLLEYAGVRHRLNRIQMRCDAQSATAIEVSRIISQPHLEGYVDRRNQNQLSSSVLTRDDSRCLACVLPNLDVPRQQIASAVFDESAKINVNALAIMDRKDAVRRLLVLPGMTRPMAEAVLDWIDPDDTASDYGAETAWYQSRLGSVLPPQKAIDSLTELLNVRGVSSALLFGEDRNGNGILDPNEDDGAESNPDDNRDGRLDRGWSRYLTVFSTEPARDLQGRSRIYLNDQDLAKLFDRVQRITDAETARFIVAYRIAGPSGNLSAFQDASNTLSAAERLERQLRDADQQLNLSDLQNRSARQRVVRGGLDLSVGAAYQIRSLFDLIGTRVRVTIDQQDRVLESPWNSDASGIERFILGTGQRLACSPPGTPLGTVNILQAERTVLRSVPGLSSAAIDGILLARGSDRKSTRFDSLAWLMESRLFDLDGLREIAPHLNTGGTVFSGFAIGQSADSPVAVVRQFVFEREGMMIRFRMTLEHPVVMLDCLPTSLAKLRATR